MSLDTSFNPQGFTGDGGFPGGAIEASTRIRNIASSPALTLDTEQKFGTYTGPNGKMGTIGQRVVFGKGGKNNAQFLGPSVTTDWFAIFSAFLNKRNDEGEHKEIQKIADLGKRLFTSQNASIRPMLRFKIHSFLGEGMEDLMPKGLLTVALTYDGGNLNSKANNNQIGDKEGAIPRVLVDMIFQDFTGDRKTAKKLGISSIAASITEDDESDLFDDLDISTVGVSARRKAAKKPSKKKGTQGQLIAIDLTPPTHVRLSKAVEKATYMKEINKEDGDFKNLWNKYGRGNKPIRSKQGRKIAWKWRGKAFIPTKEDKARDPSSKKPPAALKNLIKKEGTYADYKDGKANMRMLYAPRKDNGNLVPFRLVVPKILVRLDPKTNLIIAKKNSADTGKMQKLLARLTNDFGPLEFKNKPLAVGGYDRYPIGKKSGDKKDPLIRIDRGVSRVYQAKGLETPSERFSTRAHPSSMRPDGSIIYSAMTRGGQAIDMEVR